MDPFIAPPVPDRLGTAALELPAGVRDARVVSPALYALDLTTHPELEALDLRGCGPGLRLTLQAHAALRAVRLPTGASVVFLTVDGCGPLTFEGTLKTLDASWTNARGAARALAAAPRRGEVLRGLHLGPIGSTPATGIDAWVVTGGALADGALDACAARHLWLFDCAAPDGVEVRRPLELLALHHVETTRLRFLEARKVRVKPCGALAAVAGSTPHLLLRDGARIDTLTIEGLVDEADLLGVRCRTLRAPGCRALRLSRAEDIVTVHVLGADAPVPDRARAVSAVPGRAQAVSPVTVRCEGACPDVRGDHRRTVRVYTPREIEHQFFEGGVAGRDAMFAWATRCTRPADVETALRVLCSAVDSDHASSEQAWQARNALHRRLSARASWSWPLAEDVALQGYATDLRLWLRHLVDRPADARAEAERFTESGAPSNLAALLYVAAAPDLDPDERDVLLELAERACRRGAAHGPRLDRAARPVPTRRAARGPRVEGLSREDISYLDVACASLLQNAAHPRALGVAAQLGHWIAARAPTQDGVRVLGRLRAHGCDEAVFALERVRRELAARDGLDAQAREQLLLALTRVHLLPPEQPRFAA